MALLYSLCSSDTPLERDHNRLVLARCSLCSLTETNPGDVGSTVRVRGLVIVLPRLVIHSPIGPVPPMTPWIGKAVR